jgi:hypothetical protein
MSDITKNKLQSIDLSEYSTFICDIDANVITNIQTKFSKYLNKCIDY